MFITDNRTTIRRPIPGAVQGLGASKLAVVTLPPGLTYRSVTLQSLIASTAPTRAEFESMWTQIRILLSGEEIATMTSLQWIAMQEFYRTGVIGDTGHFFIPFDRPWQRTQEGVEGPGLGTDGEGSFTIEITQSAGCTIDSVVANVALDPKAAPLGKYVKYVRRTPALPGAGLKAIPDLFKNPNDVLYALHVEVSTAADLTSLTFSGDGYRIFDTITQSQLASIYLQNGYPARTLQTAKKVISFDFCSDGYDRPIPLTMLDQIIETNFANAPTVLNIIAEIGTEKRRAG